MRIKSVKLTDYKRFTKELTIKDIPANVRLVIMLGPNGCGKSCVFDGFLVKSMRMASVNNYSLNNPEFDQYYHISSTPSSTTYQVADRVDIEFHDANSNGIDWKSAFNIRSPYRHEADFQINSLQNLEHDESKRFRFRRIIDQDRCVADNYQLFVWNRLADLDYREVGNTTFDEYRKKSLRKLQTEMQILFQKPTLFLQDFGGLENSGSFRFTKGTAEDFHYKNLSGGEKAAFDILLDIFVKRDRFPNAVWCIDEPELHIATSLHGPLLRAMLQLLPESCQLWIATHSIGFAREAYTRMKANEDVAFIDFYDHDFDDSVELAPRVPNRSFWNVVYQDALADIGDLVAPARIVLCEGDAAKGKEGFDAKCYSLLFAEDQPDTMFISRGGCGQVLKSHELVQILESVARGIEVTQLVDLDDRTITEQTELKNDGKRVLGRREIEDYLFDPEVLRTFLKNNTCHQSTIDQILGHQQLLLTRDGKQKCVKQTTKQLFQFIKDKSKLSNLGSTPNQFALEHLVPALRATTSVFLELSRDIFGDSRNLVN